VTDTLRKCAYLLRQESRLRWAAVLVVAVFVSGVEAVGALLVFLLLGLVTSGEADLDLPVIGSADNLPLVGSSDNVVIWLAAAVAIFFVIRGALLLGQLYVQDRLAHHAGARLAVRLFTAYLSMPYAFHLQRNSAELIRNANESVKALTSEIIIPSVRLVSHTVLALGMLAVLVYAAPLATVFAVGFLGPVVFVLLRLVHPRLKKLGRGRQRLSKANLSLLQVALHGIREVLLFDRAAYFIRKFRGQQLATARIVYTNRIAQEFPRVLIETVLVVFIAVFFILSTTLDRSPEETLAVLGLFAYAALRLQPSLQKIVQSLNSIRFAGAAVDNVYDDLSSIEPVMARELRRGETDSLSYPVPPPRIELRGVGYRYPGASEPALRHVDLVIEPGSSIGIVGPTGGGKSTLLDVLAGLLPATEGQVLVDGVELQSLGRGWRAVLGVVPQTIFLTDDTIRRNIALAERDDSIDERRLQRAVDVAQLGTFIAELPDGLDTRVGERGVRISGGQRQRVAIARALYRDPTLLLFDEGTSALDSLTEAEFVAALEALGQDRTRITVAHRLTTVRNCDLILVIDGGTVIDSGTYDELRGRNSLFGSRAESPTHS
jgi:ATP-binding cassette, subfamily B, bacterial PglK